MCVSLKCCTNKIFAVKTCTHVFDFAHEPANLRGNIDHEVTMKAGHQGAANELNHLLLYPLKFQKIKFYLNNGTSAKTVIMTISVPVRFVGLSEKLSH